MPFNITRVQTYDSGAIDDVMQLLTRNDNAAHFRDIKKYTAWRYTRDNGIFAEYPVSCLGFKKTACIHLVPKGENRVDFDARVWGVRSTGCWLCSKHWLTGKLSVLLKQTVEARGVTRFLPIRKITEKRVTRAFEDIGTYLQNLQNKHKESNATKDA